MDLDFLTKEKVIIERVIVDPKDCDNIVQIMQDFIKNNKNYCHRDGFVRQLKKVIATKDLIITKDKFDGSYYIDVILLADILELKPGSVLFDCKIKMLTKAGIFAYTKDNLIKVLIASDNIDDDVHSKYKKGDMINVEVIVSKQTIHDNELTVFAKLHDYKLIPKNELVRTFSDVKYKENKNELKLVDKIIYHEALGYPPKLHLFDKTKDLPKPYGLVPELTKKNTNELELLEILHILKIKDKKDVFFKNYLDSETYKSSITINTTGKAELGFFIASNKDVHHDLVKILSYIVKNKHKQVIIKLPMIVDYFSVEFLIHVKSMYRQVWLCKPQITMGQNLYTYIVAHKFTKEMNKKLIKQVPRGKFVDTFIKDNSVIRNFNTSIYNLYITNHIEGSKYEKDNKDKQKELSNAWIKKYIA